MFGAAAVRKKKQKAKDANAEALKRGPYIKPFGPRLGCHGWMISFFISLKFNLYLVMWNLFCKITIDPWHLKLRFDPNELPYFKYKKALLEAQELSESISGAAAAAAYAAKKVDW